MGIRQKAVWLAVLAAFRSTHWPEISRAIPSSVPAFMKKHPCPANGKTSGGCPGYVVDHIKPLCARGADRPSNMQWQTKAAAKAKDREERAQRAGKRAPPWR